MVFVFIISKYLSLPLRFIVGAVLALLALLLEFVLISLILLVVVVVMLVELGGLSMSVR